MRKTVFVGEFETLQRIVAYCREQLYTLHGPAKGEEVYSRLKFTTAVEMWQRRPT